MPAPISPQRPSRGGLLLLAAVLCLGLTSPAPGAQSKGDARLKEATKLVRSQGEDALRRGAFLCAEIDSVESIELLLKVLAEGQPHRRDVVWEALPSFTDAEAREQVVLALVKSKRNEGMRQWCAQLLGLYGDARAAEVLEKALDDKSPAVRAAAAQALGRIGEASAAAALARLGQDKDARTRAYACEAAATLDVEGHGELLRRGLDDEDAGVRCFLLGCVPALLGEELEALCGPRLQDPDWRVRLQAAENLAQARTRTCVDLLVEASADARPVVAHAVRESLARLTGQSWNKPKQWRLWWQAERDGFDPENPPETPAASDGERTVAVRYNDLPVESDHVAFLVDISGGMRERLKSVDGTKAEAARSELARVLGLLEGRLMFNVYAYDTLAPAFAKKPVELDARSAKKALAFVDDANPRGSKDIWNAINTALEDSELDTLYLLASGEPEIGLYVHHNRIAEHLRELLRFHKVVIHGVAYTDSAWYADQIEEICKATGGEFRQVE